jgi:hypothetical protein
MLPARCPAVVLSAPHRRHRSSPQGVSFHCLPRFVQLLPGLAGSRRYCSCNSRSFAYQQRWLAIARLSVLGTAFGVSDALQLEPHIQGRRTNMRDRDREVHNDGVLVCSARTHAPFFCLSGAACWMVSIGSQTRRHRKYTCRFDLALTIFRQRLMQCQCCSVSNPIWQRIILVNNIVGKES